MNSSGDTPQSQKLPPFPVKEPLVLGAKVGIVTLLVVFLGLFGGLALDRVFNTKPLFTIVLLVGSAPLALFLTFLIAKKAAKKLQQTIPSPPTSAGGVRIYDKEDNGE